MSRLAVLILAGGRSSRMGEPKDSVALLDGRVMIDHVVEALEALGVPMYLSVDPTTPGRLTRLGIPTIADRNEYEGPLAAIARALGSIDADALLAAGCDQPLLRADLLTRLLLVPAGVPAFFASPSGESLAPFPGVFPSCCLASMRSALEAGERSVCRWLEGQQQHFVPLDPGEVATLESFNSPADLRRRALIAT